MCYTNVRLIRFVHAFKILYVGLVYFWAIHVWLFKLCLSVGKVFCKGGSVLRNWYFIYFCLAYKETWYYNELFEIFLRRTDYAPSVHTYIVFVHSQFVKRETNESTNMEHGKWKRFFVMKISVSVSATLNGAHYLFFFSSPFLFFSSSFDKSERIRVYLSNAKEN